MTFFSWLHLGDLHWGMAEQEAFWPNIEQEFFRDLEAMHAVSGPWDFIIFSGDLVHTGSREEYNSVNEILRRLYDFLASLGSTPVLITVPGNHDLSRPKANLAELKVLREWDHYKDMQEEFWKEEKSSYRQIVTKSFANYVEWETSHPFPRIPEDSIQRGILPGDFSCTIEKSGVRLGIVGLNSTFLQLTSGDLQGKLALDSLQLRGVCGKHYVDWFNDRSFSLLVTHQPPDWLTPKSSEVFNGEINKAGRFIAHLFGHMHENQSYSGSRGGGRVKRSWQTCSLFGLENYGDNGEYARRHGYAVGKISIDGPLGKIKLWPRRAERHQDGHWHIIADPSYTQDVNSDLEEFKINAPKKTQLTSHRRRIAVIATEQDLGDTRRSVAEHLKRSLGVDVVEGCKIEDFEKKDYAIAVLIQGWWWDQGKAVKAWQNFTDSTQMVFLVNDESEWPPRRLSERSSEEEIIQFRDSLVSPYKFDNPDELRSLIGKIVNEELRKNSGKDGIGLVDWERTYLEFRLPAWTAGRTALSRVHLLESEHADELYKPDLYISLDGVSQKWISDKEGCPRQLTKREVEKGELGEHSEKRRVRLGRWLSVQSLPRVVLVGAPGGGKTIFLTRIAASLANTCLGNNIDLEPDLRVEDLRRFSGLLPIPVVIEATRIAGHKPPEISSLIEAMADEIAAANGQKPDVMAIQKGLKDGRYLLLIDALDEIPEAAIRSKVLDLLKGISAKAVFPKTRIVLTTRSARYTGDLGFLPELQVVEVAPLSISQVEQLCSSWSIQKKRDAEYERTLMEAVNGLNHQVESTPEDQALTENPLMLTAICMVFERYRSLPDDRGRLCDLLTDDLCRSRNSEDPENNWRLEDAGKKDLLQRIAFAMQTEGSQTWPVSRALAITLTLVPSSEEFRQNRAKKYLDWTADHTGLLRFQPGENGEEQLRFWHRLFREYLAANRIAKLDTTASDKVLTLWNEGRLSDPFWEDVIRLLPGTLGTVEKAHSFRIKLYDLGMEYPDHRGRLFGLMMAAIIETRTLFPDVDAGLLAKEMADVYEAEGNSWPLKDRLLFLESLGRLDVKGQDPRCQSILWVTIPSGTVNVPIGPSIPLRVNEDNVRKAQFKRIRVATFSASWSPVTVQQFKAFLDAPESESLLPDPNALRVEGKLLRSLDQRVRSQLRHPNWPLIHVTTEEANAFCTWLTSQRSDGLVVRLPFVEEWLLMQQRAYRFRPRTKADVEKLELEEGGPLCNWAYVGLRRPSPVGAFRPDLNGLVDLTGNVFEWSHQTVEDLQVSLLYTPEDDTIDADYLMMGNFYDGDATFLEQILKPSYSRFMMPFTGFRCVLSAKKDKSVRIKSSR